MALTISIASDADLRAIARARGELEKFGNNSLTTSDKLKVMGGRMSAVGKSLSVFSAAAVAGLGMFAKSAISAATEAQVATSRLDAIAKSMGVLDPVLGGTTDRLQEFASQLQATTAVEDELIMQGQALLLTFKSVAQSAGTAGGAFDRATQAAVDLAAAGFGSVEANAKMVGKALEDPVKGLTSLRRAGVTFTESQKEMIAGMVEAGDTAGAQAFILGELERQVGGTAAATATSGAKLRVAFGELQEQIGAALLPLVARVTDFLQQRLIPAISSLVERFLSLPGSTQAAIGAFGGLVLAIGPALLIGGQMLTMLGNLPGAFRVAQLAVTGFGRALTLAFIANPVGLTITAIAVAVIFLADQFRRAYQQSEPLRAAVGQLLTALRGLGQLITSTIRSAFIGFTVDMQGTGSMLDRLANVLAPAFTIAVQGLTRYINILGLAFQVFVEILEIGAKTFELIGNLLRLTVILAISRLTVVIDQLRLAFIDLLRRMGPVGDFLQTLGSKLVSTMSAAVSAIKNLFTNLPGFIEPVINTVIRGLNKIIEGYNALAEVARLPLVTPLEEFAFRTLPMVARGAEYAREHMARLGIATRDTATATAALIPTTVASAAATEKDGAAKDKAAEAAKRAAEAQQQFKSRLDELRGALDQSIQSAVAYSASIRDRFVAGLDLGAALDKAKETGGSIVDAFIEQGKRMAAFTANMQTLLSAGLSRPAFDAIISAGTTRGAEIADALIKGNVAENVRGVNQVYESVRDMGVAVGNQASVTFNQMGIALAVQALTGLIQQFMPAGRKRRELLAAIDSMVGEAMSALSRIPSSVPFPSFGGGGGGGSRGGESTAALPDEFTPIPGSGGGTRDDFTFHDILGPGGVVPLARGGQAQRGQMHLVGERGPELFVPGVTGQVIPNDTLTSRAAAGVGGNTFHITVNAGMGTDGADVGRRIVDAIRKYERFSGPVFVAA